MPARRTSRTPPRNRCGTHPNRVRRWIYGRPGNARRGRCRCTSGTDSWYGRDIRQQGCLFVSLRAEYLHACAGHVWQGWRPHRPYTVLGRKRGLSGNRRNPVSWPCATVPARLCHSGGSEASFHLARLPTYLHLVRLPVHPAPFPNIRAAPCWCPLYSSAFQGTSGLSLSARAPGLRYIRHGRPWR